MGNIEFLNYIPTPNEKHLGIATIRIDKRIILRYKIVPMKEGSGYFPTASSYKITEDGVDRYIPAFILDSNFEKEEVESLIKSNVKRFMAGGAGIPVKGPGFVQNNQGGVVGQVEDGMPF